MTSEVLKARSRKSLATLARRQGVSGWHSMTKDELVRTLLRLARTKPAASAATRRAAAKPARQPATRTPAARQPAVRQRRSAGTPRNGSAAKSRNGHLPLPRSRDLCTTEVTDQGPKGRTNFLDVTVCDAHWIRADWDLTRDSIRRAETRLGADWHGAVPVLRLFEVATEEGSTTADRFVKDILIEAGVNTWYIPVPREARIFRLHIGYRTARGTFFAIAKSNPCSMPQISLRLPGVNPTDLPRNGHNGNSEKTSGRSRENGEKPDGRLGRPLGFASLSHFGPAATHERDNGEFSFTLDAELIIHGLTRPGANLTVQGETVELRDDGSFTIRVGQPEGRQVIAFTAMCPHGSERRMIVLGVERNTKELERQYFDGGNPDGFSD